MQPNRLHRLLSETQPTNLVFMHMKLFYKTQLSPPAEIILVSMKLS